MNWNSLNRDEFNRIFDSLRSIREMVNEDGEPKLSALSSKGLVGTPMPFPPSNMFYQRLDQVLKEAGHLKHFMVCSYVFDVTDFSEATDAYSSYGIGVDDVEDVPRDVVAYWRVIFPENRAWLLFVFPDDYSIFCSARALYDNMKLDRSDLLKEFLEYSSQEGLEYLESVYSLYS